MRYLIWGYYGYGNLGDELMLKVLVDRISAADKKAQIAAKFSSSSHPPKGVRAVDLDSSFAHAKRSFGLSLVKLPLLLVKEIKKADVFVIGGGTLFLDKGKHNWSLFVLDRAVSLAKILGKKIVVVGFGIDEMHHTASKKYMERILRNADYLCPRDDYSFNECIRVRGGHDGLIKGADLLFSMPDVGSNRKGRKKKIAVLSITRAAGVYSSSGCILEENKIRRSIRHLVTGLTESGFEVRLVSLQKRFGERDYELCREFVSGGSISHIHADSLESIESVIDGASVVIGMRFHALVFAALKGIPFVGIAHERKISAICEEFSMPYLTLSDFMSNNENVIKLAERLPRLDRTKVEKLRKLAENNFRFLEMME